MGNRDAVRPVVGSPGKPSADVQSNLVDVGRRATRPQPSPERTGLLVPGKPLLILDIGPGASSRAIAIEPREAIGIDPGTQLELAAVTDFTSPSLDSNAPPRPNGPGNARCGWFGSPGTASKIAVRTAQRGFSTATTTPGDVTGKIDGPFSPDCE
jgi:hypothetical protein